MGRTKEIEPERIFRAADRIIQSGGVNALTIEAIAREAGISKGAVLYSYRSKEALIEAMVQRLNADYVDVLHRNARLNKDDPAALLLAHLDTSRRDDDTASARTAAMVASLVRNPQHGPAIRDYYRQLFDLVDPGTREGRRLRSVLLAIEGLFWLRGLGMKSFTEAERADMFADLAAIIAEATTRG